MFGFFGLGTQEIVILLIIGLVLVVLPVSVILVVLVVARRKPPRDEIAELRAENDRLRKGLDRRQRSE